ncbi:uncharacterized protein LOC132791454 isoform X1 [Drosophila nasuta]|uniref:uncharacterized protein LOC132791454 isoform X1 n=1 Tax=Drosophila nasuta TaxID=42062 RepID=UPI00295F07C2|nr:uncharacterized protein LOC132791454 isoform X1 [Drosophila nasuta]
MGHVTYTNLKCILRNSTVLAFQHCYIKAVNRTHKYIAIHINNFSRDVLNVSMNIKVLRFNHGYKPFFFDITFDACKYMKTQNDPIVNLFFNSFKHAANLNHTCPFNVSNQFTFIALHNETYFLQSTISLWTKCGREIMKQISSNICQYPMAIICSHSPFIAIIWNCSRYKFLCI